MAAQGAVIAAVIVGALIAVLAFGKQIGGFLSNLAAGGSALAIGAGQLGGSFIGAPIYAVGAGLNVVNDAFSYLTNAISKIPFIPKGAQSGGAATTGAGQPGLVFSNFARQRQVYPPAIGAQVGGAVAPYVV